MIPLISGMLSSLLMGGIRGLLAGGQQGGGGQMPAVSMTGMPIGRAPVMTPPVNLGGYGSYFGRYADGGIMDIPPIPPGETPQMAAAMDRGGMIRGPGSGVDDFVHGSIDNRQKVLLSDGEFVVPARVVSALGDGSSEAGAEVLHGMLDRVKQEAAKKLKDNGKINLKKVLPA
jgi:hypothetical protein